MTTRRRKLLIAAALLGVVAALVWWFGRGGGRMEVKLVFVGYTNEVPARSNAFGKSRPYPSEINFGLVMATNSGKVPVKLYRDMRDENFVITVGGSRKLRDGFGIPFLLDNPTLVDPGTGTLVYVVMDPCKPWSTEILMQRKDWRDRFDGMLQKRLGASLPAWVDKMLPRPEKVWATIGPITNLPPDMPAVKRTAASLR